MKTLTVLSGKGGVGKSTITASLAVLLEKRHQIIVADCDVDAPNLGLILGTEDKDFQLMERIQTRKRAILNDENCNACQKCSEICNYSALTWDNVKNLPIINNLLCLGCGACTIACHNHGIELESVENATVKIGETEYGFPIVTGELDIGASGSGKVVNAVKIWGSELGATIDAEILLVDSAAGIGCPVIASLKGSDYVLLITEPTPAGFSDLLRAIKLVNHFNIPHGVIINKYNININYTKQIEEFFMSNNIEVIGKIPYDMKFTNALVKLKPVVIFESKFEELFRELFNKIDFIDV
jgi:MinD superfamily P-loop ATPase